MGYWHFTMSTATTFSPSPQQLHRPKRAGVLGHLPNETLFVRWQQGADRQARDELVQRFLPLARKLARRYSGAREPFDDLMQVASLGLVKA
ncbi:MAG: sigma-70 family RNA polymerase sigma factor, partial [Actinomycetes bacterium]